MAQEQVFEAFPEIKKLGGAQLSITQKIHGTNAQVYIYEDKVNLKTFSENPTEEEMIALTAAYPDKKLSVVLAGPNLYFLYGTFLNLKCGSRTRWVAPGNDNFGFAEHVHSHKQEYIDMLGQGRHYGEWAGNGINSGEGLKDKVFVLFDYWKYPPERSLPPKTVIVPVLYEGKFDLGKIDEVMADLKANGSKLAPGYMSPEGVVVRIKGERYKVVFQAEETGWKSAKSEKTLEKNNEAAKAQALYGHLLQPIRLEKLLSRDEAYLRDYPKTMPVIAADYFADLLKEGQIAGSEDEIKGVRKMLGKNLFKFIQESVEKQRASV